MIKQNCPIDHFLNDENHSHIACPRKKKLDRICENMNEWEQLLLSLYLCILGGENLESTFPNFITIRKLEVYFTNLFNNGKNNQH